MQGQLNISRRKYCYFIVYVSDSFPLHVEKIERDEKLWNMDMLPKLINFYKKFILPELINRNIPRGLKCSDEM